MKITSRLVFVAVVILFVESAAHLVGMLSSHDPKAGALLGVLPLWVLSLSCNPRYGLLGSKIPVEGIRSMALASYNAAGAGFLLALFDQLRTFEWMYGVIAALSLLIAALTAPFEQSQSWENRIALFVLLATVTKTTMMGAVSGDSGVAFSFAILLLPVGVFIHFVERRAAKHALPTTSTST